MKKWLIKYFCYISCCQLANYSCCHFAYSAALLVKWAMHFGRGADINWFMIGIKFEEQLLVSFCILPLVWYSQIFNLSFRLLRTSFCCLAFGYFSFICLSQCCVIHGCITVFASRHTTQRLRTFALFQFQGDRLRSGLLYGKILCTRTFEFSR